MALQKGTVKFFNDKKGFGFIKVQGGQDIFFHATDLLEGYDPKEDDKVEFETKQGKKGLAAVNVGLEETQ